MNLEHTCNQRRHTKGQSYPRTCIACGLGPCKLNQSELNPQHPVTESVHDQWHKLLALTMVKHGWDRLIITHEDIEKLVRKSQSGGINIAVQEKEDGIHLTLVDNKTAHLLANS